MKSFGMICVSCWEDALYASALPPSMLSTCKCVGQRSTVNPQPLDICKLQSKDAASFDCNLQMSKGCGFTVDLWPTHLQVLSIDGGSAEAYNASSQQDTQIMPNDFIVMVNGATNPREMKEKLSRDVAVAMKMVHPSSLVVKLDKSASPLGLKLAIHTTLGSCLWIDQIEDGAVLQYNAGKATKSQLAPGDLIESVNGVAGVSTKMVDEIHSSEIVELVMLRLPSSSHY